MKKPTKILPPEWERYPDGDEGERKCWRVKNSNVTKLFVRRFDPNNPVAVKRPKRKKK